MLHGLQPYFGFITDDMKASGIALAGGGAGSHKGSCGAFSGGLMALAAKYCPRSLDYTDEDLARLDKALQISFEFRDWFISEFSGVNCPDVLFKLFGFSTEWNTDEQWQELRKIQERSGFTCDLVIEKAVIKTAEMMYRIDKSASK